MKKIRKFAHLKPGDRVTRMVAGVIPMQLEVTEIHGNLIFCGDWSFDVDTGAEIDEDLHWGPKYGVTGSFLILPS